MPVSSAQFCFLVTVGLLDQFELDQDFREEILDDKWARRTWTSRWSRICGQVDYGGGLIWRWVLVFGFHYPWLAFPSQGAQSPDLDAPWEA